MWTTWTKIALWKRSLIALALGVTIGLVLKENAIFLKPVGDTFLKLLRMMIMPLIFITLIHSIINLKNTARLGSLAFKGILWFVGTTGLAITLAIIVAEIVKPGLGVSMDFANATVIQAKTPPTLLETLLNIIPSNPYQAFIEGNVLQVIFLAVVIGIALMNINTDKIHLTNVINTANDIVAYIVKIIMELMPIGIFALLAYTASILGYNLLLKLGAVAAVVVGLCLFQVFVVFSLILRFKGHDVKHFFKHAMQAMIVAFSTSSSSATLPTTMEVAKNMGISRDSRSFILPLGSTINMNGSALHQAVVTVFIAQMVGFDLTMNHYFIILVTTIISAIGTAGVPGVGLIMLTLVLNAVGLPLEGIAIIAGIDRILDMTRTSVNVAGDLVVARILSSENEEEIEKNIAENEILES